MTTIQRRSMVTVLLISVAGLSCGFVAGQFPATVSALSGIKDIRLPDGFRIEIFASGVSGARSMTMSPSGILYVGTRSKGNVYALVPRPTGGHEIVTVAKGLQSPNGVAFRDGALYVAEISRVLRFDDIDKSYRNSPSYKIVNDGFPSDGHHGWKYIAFGPDDKLYVPVGAPCNTCERDDKRYASIMRMNPDGSGLELYASGIRNTVGFAWSPVDKSLWFTDNGRDWMGDDMPPDELNHAPRMGMHFGFPYLFGKAIRDEDYQMPSGISPVPAALELGPHVAALGMKFYTGKMFPERYRNGIFIAEHGSWNRSKAIGYRVMFVSLKDNKPASYEVFAEGWLDGSSAWGRPVDVLVMPDGSLLVSDDKGDAVYRISYGK